MIIKLKIYYSILSKSKMCMFILECFGNYIKSVGDCIMGIICGVSSTIGITLLTCKYYNVKFIDNNITWIEASTPLAVGTGGCIMYNLICYGTKRLCKRRIPETAVELIDL